MKGRKCFDCYSCVSKHITSSSNVLFVQKMGYVACSLSCYCSCINTYFWKYCCCCRLPNHSRSNSIHDKYTCHFPKSLFLNFKRLFWSIYYLSTFKRNDEKMIDCMKLCLR